MRSVSSPTIRSFRSADRAALVELWSEVFPEDPPRNAPESMIDNKLRVQSDLLMVADVDNRLVGAVMAGFDGTRGWIHHLAVAPRYRLKGIATALLRAAEDGLQRLGCPKVNLQVRAEDDGVVAFYRALGYSVERRVSMGKVLGTEPTDAR